MASRGPDEGSAATGRRTQPMNPSLRLPARRGRSRAQGSRRDVAPRPPYPVRQAGRDPDAHSVGLSRSWRCVRGARLQPRRGMS
eukprot:3297496-Pyramimonas_sp.AAC.1